MSDALKHSLARKPFPAWHVDLSPAAATLGAAFFIQTSVDSFGNCEFFNSARSFLPPVIAQSLIPETFLREEKLLCSGLLS
jgi:hypothetical protein